ncbi:hypothetical protein [Desertivirga arenae]|uniref:hypothetical protein n=1 Tax=Desertivirga arenae TaxID=2810309 RepID=UPI001A95F4D8|nr:hypothetical protein [Pedobacter sp. SYSU D00823]
MKPFFKHTLALMACTIAIANTSNAQQLDSIPQSRADSKPKTELKLNLSADGSKYIKATFLNQVWLRWNESNPNTAVLGEHKDHTLDIGLRRTRMQLFGQVTDRVFFYTQFGMNNFNFLSQNAGNRKLQAFFHDALGEYKVFKSSDKLKLGGGLTIANGLSRFSQPSVSTIMTTDVPVFLQTTVDQTDEFARKLSVYARGQLGKLDYRLVLSDPFPIQTNGQAAPVIRANSASFATIGHHKQYQGFFAYNFLDKEPNVTPYMTGTYLGDKKVLNLEGGFIYQKKATWYLTDAGTTNYNDLAMWSVAAFADMPIRDNKYALSAYAGYFDTGYGKNYVRNNGIMNPANEATPGSPVYGGAFGNSYPMFGTGESVYAQAGLRLPKDLLGENGTLMPYVSYRYAKYDALKDGLSVYDAGLNWLINKHQSKVSLNYQLRPVVNTAGEVKNNASSVWLQYQIAF